MFIDCSFFLVEVLCVPTLPNHKNGNTIKIGKIRTISVRVIPECYSVVCCAWYDTRGRSAFRSKKTKEQYGAKTHDYDMINR